MGTRSIIAGAIVAASALMPTSAEACSCMWQDLSWHYNNTDMMLEVNIFDEFTSGMYRVFKAEVVREYKGCDAQWANQSNREFVALRTSISGASCGVNLNVGTNYVVSATATGEVVGDWVSGNPPYSPVNIYSIGLCGYNVEASMLTPNETDFLNTRQRTCPNLGIDECGDSSLSVVNCLQDPCNTAPGCATGTCEANYCGGCNYDYFDIEGTKVCPSL